MIRGKLPRFIRDECQSLRVLDLTRCRELVDPIPEDLMMDHEQKVSAGPASSSRRVADHAKHASPRAGAHTRTRLLIPGPAKIKASSY